MYYTEDYQCLRTITINKLSSINGEHVSIQGLDDFSIEELGQIIHILNAMNNSFYSQRQSLMAQYNTATFNLIQ